MRVLICDDEQKMIDLEVSMLQKYCQSANVIATFYAFTQSKQIKYIVVIRKFM